MQAHGQESQPDVAISTTLDKEVVKTRLRPCYLILYERSQAWSAHYPGDTKRRRPHGDILYVGESSRWGNLVACWQRPPFIMQLAVKGREVSMQRKGRTVLCGRYSGSA